MLVINESFEGCWNFLWSQLKFHLTYDLIKGFDGELVLYYGKVCAVFKCEVYSLLK